MYIYIYILVKDPCHNDTDAPTSFALKWHAAPIRMGIDCKLDLLVIQTFFIYIYTYVYVFIHLPSISIVFPTSYICICLAGQLAREINAKIHMTIDAKSVTGAA